MSAEDDVRPIGTNRSMKVLVNAVSAQSGGGLTYLVNVARELARDSRGHQFHFLVRADRSPALSALETSACRIDPVSFTHVAHRLVWEQTTLPRLSRAYDVLFCAADLAPIRKPVPTIVSLRNLNIYDQTYYSTLRLQVFKRIAELGLRSIDRVLFPSEAAAHAIGESLDLPRGRSSVIHYGIDTDRFRAAGDRHLSDEHAPFVLVPAAVEKHKNFEVVVDCLAHLELHDVEIWVAGSDVFDLDYARSIRRRSEDRGVSSRLRFLGAVDYERLPELYAKASAVLLPSFLETFGHPLLEAMASGTALVTSDLSVFDEIAGDSAWPFPRSDGRALAKTLSTVLRGGGQVDERIRLGRQRAATFTWARYVDELCEVLRLTSEARPKR